MKDLNLNSENNIQIIKILCDNKAKNSINLLETENLKIECRNMNIEQIITMENISYLISEIGNFNNLIIDLSGLNLI